MTGKPFKKQKTSYGQTSDHNGQEKTMNHLSCTSHLISLMSACGNPCRDWFFTAFYSSFVVLRYVKLPTTYSKPITHLISSHREKNKNRASYKIENLATNQNQRLFFYIRNKTREQKYGVAPPDAHHTVRSKLRTTGP